jgi:hypothetical protein
LQRRRAFGVLRGEAVHQVVVDQQRQVIQHRQGVRSARAAHGGDGVQGGASSKDAETAEEAPRARREQGMAPGDGVAQAAVAGGLVVGATGEHGERVIEVGHQRVGGQYGHSGSGQFNGQREPVQAPA